MILPYAIFSFPSPRDTLLPLYDIHLIGFLLIRGVTIRRAIAACRHDKDARSASRERRYYALLICLLYAALWYFMLILCYAARYWYDDIFKKILYKDFLLRLYFLTPCSPLRALLLLMLFFAMRTKIKRQKDIIILYTLSRADIMRKIKRIWDIIIFDYAAIYAIFRYFRQHFSDVALLSRWRRAYKDARTSAPPFRFIAPRER